MDPAAIKGPSLDLFLVCQEYASGTPSFLSLVKFLPGREGREKMGGRIVRGRTYGLLLPRRLTAGVLLPVDNLDCLYLLLTC